MANESLPTASQNEATDTTSTVLAGIAPSGLKGWQTLASAVGVGLPAALSDTNRVLDSSIRLLSGQAG